MSSILQNKRTDTKAISKVGSLPQDNSIPSTIGIYRWRICALVFFATTINYLDRQVISLLKSTLSGEFHWDDGDYSNIEIAFKIFYALGMLAAGTIVDKLGTKKGYAMATTLWSIAAVSTAFVKSVFGFGVVRSALGLTESGNFPAAIKTVSEWFPKKERALATGIFNSGANIGAIIAPLTVPIIAYKYGWEWAFIITGMLGFVWLVLWLIYYDTPANSNRLMEKEYQYINSDKEVETLEDQNKSSVSWFKLLSFRQTWAFVLGKLLTDPIWWFYLFWLPDFLQSEYRLDNLQLIFPVAIVYTISTLGSVGGGWLPMRLINKGWPVFKARRASMFVFALLVLPIVLSQVLGKYNMWFAILIIGIAASAHQAWSANIFTTVSDMFPKKITASVTGLGGMFGGLGGVMLSLFVQKKMFVYYRSIGQIETAYYIMFIICGGSYLFAWLIMKLLVPVSKPVEV
jgi:ACS family hexuronate transporter-like MFS transporter